MDHYKELSSPTQTTPAVSASPLSSLISQTYHKDNPLPHPQMHPLGINTAPPPSQLVRTIPSPAQVTALPLPAEQIIHLPQRQTMAGEHVPPYCPGLLCNLIDWHLAQTVDVCTRRGAGATRGGFRPFRGWSVGRGCRRL